jgi:hypothetical protein
MGTLPVPVWQLGKSVSLESLNKVTDAYLGSLEPARKLSIPSLPASVKDSVAGFARSAGHDAKSASELLQLLSQVGRRATDAGVGAVALCSVRLGARPARAAAQRGCAPGSCGMSWVGRGRAGRGGQGRGDGERQAAA